MRSKPLLVLALCTLALAGCRKPEPKQTEAERARAVRVVVVEPRAVVGSLAASGDLVPREEASVASEVSGYRVTRVVADVGDHVRAGQVLAVLDPSLLEAQLAQAKAQAAQAEDQAKRVSGLDGEGVLSQEQIAQRRYQAEIARASLRNLETQRRKLSVTAPVSGVILARNVRPGDQSALSTTPWFRIARDSLVELAAQVNEADLARIRPGQAASVTLPGGEVVEGKVRLISPQIDSQTKLGEVRVALPVRSDIRAGGFARAVFGDASQIAPTVPETALRYDADGASVMVLGADNRVRRAPVKVAARGGGLAQLAAGPPVGARVVAAASALLLDGDMVRPMEAAAPPARTPAAGQ